MQLETLFLKQITILLFRMETWLSPSVQLSLLPRLREKEESFKYVFDLERQ